MGIGATLGVVLSVPRVRSTSTLIDGGIGRIVDDQTAIGVASAVPSAIKAGIKIRTSCAQRIAVGIIVGSCSL